MRWSRNILILGIVGILSLSVQYSFATPSLEISTSKSVYEYGDLLSITFHVSELTGKQITLHIVDSSGNSSSPIQIPIDSTNYTQVFPVPFNRAIFSPGTYSINAEYDDTKANTTFSIKDTGKISIPSELKTIVNLWQKGTVNDSDYANFIRELINLKILNVQNYDNETNLIHIPKWFKHNPYWWADGLISDNDLGTSIQYLIQKGIMVV